MAVSRQPESVPISAVAMQIDKQSGIMAVQAPLALAIAVRLWYRYYTAVYATTTTLD